MYWRNKNDPPPWFPHITRTNDSRCCFHCKQSGSEAQQQKAPAKWSKKITVWICKPDCRLAMMCLTRGVYLASRWRSTRSLFDSWGTMRTAKTSRDCYSTGLRLPWRCMPTNWISTAFRELKHILWKIDQDEMRYLKEPGMRTPTSLSSW